MAARNQIKSGTKAANVIEKATVREMTAEEKKALKPLKSATRAAKAAKAEAPAEAPAEEKAPKAKKVAASEKLMKSIRDVGEGLGMELGNRTYHVKEAEHMLAFCQEIAAYNKANPKAKLAVQAHGNKRFTLVTPGAEKNSQDWFAPTFRATVAQYIASK